MSEQLLEANQKIDIFRKQGALHNSYNNYGCGHLSKEEFLTVIAPRADLEVNSVEPFVDYTLRHESRKYVKSQDLQAAGLMGHLRRIQEYATLIMSGD